MKAEILTIGDELLRGEIVDSNKTFLAERLLTVDVESRYQISVCDDPKDMTDCFRNAVARADIVIVSGGLGPTRDDLTAQVLAQTFGREMCLDDASLETIQAFFQSVGREMAPNNAKQAYFPAKAEVLPNPLGTAPGFMIEEQGALVFCLPGVPRELYRMMDEEVLPRIALRAAGQHQTRFVSAALLSTFGIGESSLDADLKDVAVGEDVSLGFRTAFPDNHLRPIAFGKSPEEADRKLDALVREIRERLGPVLYGQDGEDMPSVVGRLLREKGRTLALAESCTGGLVAEKLTGVPGASEYFLGGVVAYANEAKSALLGVSEVTLEKHGAVSEPVARAMAESARERFGADIGVATTGISGPGGGSAEKPVGLVYVALATDAETSVESFVFPLDRPRHRALTAQLALDWIRRSLLGLELAGPTLMRRGGGSTPGRRSE